jgi:hypothetical protein
METQITTFKGNPYDGLYWINARCETINEIIFVALKYRYCIHLLVMGLMNDTLFFNHVVGIELALRSLL